MTMSSEPDTQPLETLRGDHVKVVVAHLLQIVEDPARTPHVKSQQIERKVDLSRVEIGHVLAKLRTSGIVSPRTEATCNPTVWEIDADELEALAEQILDRPELGPTQKQIYTTLVGEGYGLLTSEIAERTGLGQNTTRHALDKLRDQDIVTARDDPVDAGRYLYRLTKNATTVPDERVYGPRVEIVDDCVALAGVDTDRYAEGDQNTRVTKAHLRAIADVFGDSPEDVTRGGLREWVADKIGMEFDAGDGKELRYRREHWVSLYQALEDELGGGDRDE